ncbi:hypothetical protein Scep_028768 [Stephania cephalantha]|uniref:AT hook motif-containing protein n=1 Tax=Stephania cephalantha TaxID=152367 RepID=A0AAP0HME3_9MAGN
MNLENQEMTPAAPQTLPMKRKRGRPRKDGQISVEKVPRKDGQVHVERVSAAAKPDVVTRNQRKKVDIPIVPDNPMVGQVVSGVLDGSFDAGYLLTVRVGDTDTILRGVVFAPGLSVPVSGANDVAPHVKMLKRFEVPLSTVGSPFQTRGSSSQYEQKNGLVQRNEVSLPTKVAAPVNSSSATSKGVQDDAKVFPETTTQNLQQAEEKKLNSDALYSGEQLNENNNKVVQASSQANDNQGPKAEPTEPSQNDTSDLPAIGGGLDDADKAAQHEVQKELASSNDGAASKDSVEMIPESPLKNSVDPVGPQSEQPKVDRVNHNSLADITMTYQTVGTNNAAMATAPRSMASCTELLEMFSKDQISEKDLLLNQIMKLQLRLSIIRFSHHMTQ